MESSHSETLKNKIEALSLNYEVPAKQPILPTTESLNADLIIAETSRHNRPKEMIFGSVTQNVLTNQKRLGFFAK